ncbi:hypothetical protein BVRB_5g104720 [Beta vulgaris subsp. vulgaris]|nr:hypothetical protein BVRB_5g104720 [Beta vulgaris subsp. vulgaris]
MAAEPVKSPLHNFPLTFLKWGSKKDQQRCRRTPYDSPLSPPPPPQSAAVGSRSSRNRRNNNPPTPPRTSASYDDVEERESGKKMEVAEEGEGDGDGDKGWNLRPRRAAAMKGNITTTTSSVTTMVETAGDKSTRFRGFETTQSNGGGSEKREKKKFWIALSRDEIEEDIYSMTGHKPSRRPKKRPKIVQKQVENVFPGFWLVGVTPEAYRGFDVPVKR